MLGYQKKKLELIEEEIHNALDDLQEHFNILLEETDYWYEILTEDKYVKFITDYILKKNKIKYLNENEIHKVIYNNAHQEIIGKEQVISLKSKTNDKPSDTE
mgnify:CR=1 FL=1|tara:strand:- start:2759 stop:3064 length:306 start_codon:yes stop_codon:yes gene_type:complete